jgi:hypothetical protein
MRLAMAAPEFVYGVRAICDHSCAAASLSASACSSQKDLALVNIQLVAFKREGEPV